MTFCEFLEQATIN